MSLVTVVKLLTEKDTSAFCETRGCRLNLVSTGDSGKKTIPTKLKDWGAQTLIILSFTFHLQNPLHIIDLQLVFPAVLDWAQLVLLIVLLFLVKVLQPILVLGCTPDTQSVQGHLFSDDTRCRPQQFLVEEIAKENHSNCTNPLNLIAFLLFVVIPHNTVQQREI